MPIQIVAGDLHGVNTLHHQPVKLAAMEGLWETQARAPAVLFAIPDEKRRAQPRARSRFPTLASYLPRAFADAVIKGLKEAPPEDRPPVAPVFFAFRIMVGIGVLMLGDRVLGRVAALARSAVHDAARTTTPASRCCRRASSPCSPAGRSPKSDASRGSSTA